MLQSIGEINAGAKSLKDAKAAVQQAIDALRTDSSSNPELWVKLARCALGCGCLPQAITAARTALGDSTSSPQTLSQAADQPSKRLFFKSWSCPGYVALGQEADAAGTAAL